VTRKDIIRMAREVSNTPLDHHATPDLFGVSQIERFAALVAAAERNRMISEGWRQCAQGQKTSQFCAVADRLARHGIQLPDEDEEYGNPSF
jgi:hypothetical protein